MLAFNLLNCYSDVIEAMCVCVCDAILSSVAVCTVVAALCMHMGAGG